MVRETIPAATPEVLFEPTELPMLGTLEQLRVLYHDSRARFLPTTNMEKNWALSLLDYIDILEPDAPLRAPIAGHRGRTAGQMQEVFKHQAKRHWKKYDQAPESYDRSEIRQSAIEDGQRAMKSIAFVFGDFLANAKVQRDALWQFESDLKECPNPAISLAEELGTEHKGLAPFVRFYDLAEFRRQGRVPVLGLDPLKTKVVRQDVDEPDRNKYIEDQYTTADPDDAISERIQYLSNAITIGAIRNSVVCRNVNLASAALTDQQNRLSFWTKRLREARNHAAAKPIAERVFANLGIVVR